MNLKINKSHLTIFVSLLVIEILIAVYLKSGFIRYTFGDYLATILLFSFVKSIIEIDSFKLGVSVLAVAFIIEFLQLTSILQILNLDNCQVIKIILGSTFHISDLVAYTLGIITVLIIEYKFHHYGQH